MANQTKTIVVNRGKAESAFVFPGEKGKVIVQWTNGHRVVDAEADTVMEAADKVSAKLSRSD
jgi:hypothetical protein